MNRDILLFKKIEKATVKSSKMSKDIAIAFMVTVTYLIVVAVITFLVRMMDTLFLTIAPLWIIVIFVGLFCGAGPFDLIIYIKEIDAACGKNPDLNPKSTILHKLIIVATMFDAIKNNLHTLMKILLFLGYDPNSACNKGYTPLHLIMRNLRHENSSESKKAILKTIQILIDYKADVNSVDIRKRTPLLMQSHYMCIDCIELLLENGANVNAKNKNNNTLLHIILTKKFVSDKKDSDVILMEYLIRQGADLLAKNNNGISPTNLLQSKDYYLTFQTILRIRELECLQKLRDDKNSLFYKEYFCDDAFNYFCKVL